MFYLFNKNGVTATFCADKERLFDMFSVEEEITEKDDGNILIYRMWDVWELAQAFANVTASF